MMTPKRMLLTMAAMASSALGAWAIQATPYPVTLMQPDGSTLTVRMHGDEHGAVMLTEDGRQVVQDPVTGRYEILDTKPEYRKARAKAVPQRRVKISNFPTIGEQNALVILVEFADTKFTSVADPYEYYNGMLNEEGFVWEHNGASGSARDFYMACSNGQFRPVFHVAGPVVLEHELKYYGGDSSQYLDEHAADMVIEAVTSLDDEIDFTQFDTDGDGYVDNIYFFYAGYGQADTGRTETIWPHAGQLEAGWGRELVLDGKRIDHYACSNEICGNTAPDIKPVGIGTFVHEFGHVLGLADHYDTLYTSGRIGVNDWDTMAGASYHNNQNTPPLFNAFERAELGWLEYTDIRSDEAGWLDLPALDTDNKAYRIVVEGTEGREYFVLENRRKRGWDTYLPGAGMLVWHVDMDEERWKNNTVNTDADHQCLDLIEADGRESDATYASDSFPGKSNVTQFSFKNWNEEEEFRLDHIVDGETEMHLLLGNTAFIPGSPEVNIERIGGRTLSFTWSPVANAVSYEVRLEDEDGNPIDMPSTDTFLLPVPVLIESLTPRSEYRLGVTTVMGSYRSETAWTELTTTDIQFFEMSPYIKEDMEIGNDGFRISWEPLDGALDYDVTLEYLSFGESTVSECGFSEMEMPWATNNNKLNKALYGKASPSLQLDNDGDWISFSTDEGRINEISFWARSQSSSNSFRVEVWDGKSEEWMLMIEASPKSGAATYTYEIPGAAAVRIVFGKASGYLLIDDVRCEWQPSVWESEEEYAAFNTSGECVFAPTGLKEDSLYKVSVSATNGTDKSKTASCRIRTSALTGVEAIADGARKLKACYDLFGNRVAPNAEGIVIFLYADGTMVKHLNRR